MLHEVKVESFYQSIINGAKLVINNRKHLNQINVFPVPDGDTGSNLASLMQSIIRNSEMKHSLKDTMASIADSALLGARGNSGLIFAQFIQGWAEGMKDDQILTRSDLALASKRGVDLAYQSISNPVEGTILTSMVAFHSALNQDDSASIQQVLENSLKHVEASVASTTESLAVLKKANVVDSGAKGFLYFIKGFVEGIKGHFIYLEEEEDIAALDHDHDYDDHYRYCTEALMAHERFYDLKSELEDLGDSLIVVRGRNKSRVHIHTNAPEEVFERLSGHGTFIEQKVDDMFRQKTVIHDANARVIVTDSIADLPKSYVDQHKIQVLNLGILLDEEPYIDKMTISNDRLFRLSKAKKVHPKSSQPTIKQVEFILDHLLTYYHEVIFITVASKLSGTHNVISQVAASYNKDQTRVWILDSKQNSISQGLMVYKAQALMEEGLSTPNLVSAVSRMADDAKILVGIKSLDNMIASGRLSVKAGAIAKRIHMKPIITLKDGAGAIEKIGFGYKSALNKIVDHLKTVQKKGMLEAYAVTYVDDPQGGEALKERLESELDMPCTFVVESSSIIAAGAGQGALAVGYLKKEMKS